MASSTSVSAPLLAHAAFRRGSVELDGKLGEVAWNGAQPIATFTQTQPNEGRPSVLRTEVRILYDDAALYVGARMYDPLGKQGVRGRLARRDQLLDINNSQSTNSGAIALTSDRLILNFDTFHDRLGHALFEINPLGVKGDALAIGNANLDASWDPIWEVSTSIDSLGWTAEIRIPFSQLRFSRDTVQQWGLQVERVTDRLNERAQWAFWPNREAGGPSRYGVLDGLIIPHRPRHLEVVPYTLVGVTSSPVTRGNPFIRHMQNKLRAGADVQYQLTSNLTLDAAIYPDYGQVDVDPASVNLSGGETFYEERRPFFVANAGAFDFGGLTCFFCSNVWNLGVFYPRRIGRPPQLGSMLAQSSLYVDMTPNASVLGAVKITGRTNNGYTVGLLDAVTNSVTGRSIDSASAPIAKTKVEPVTNYFVGRVTRDLRQGATTMGGVVTSTMRRLDTPLLRDNLSANATVVGADIFHTWQRREYSFSATTVLSQVTGSSLAIRKVQEANAHLWQRPDRRVRSDGLFSTRYDSNATNMRGYGTTVRLAKDNGLWRWELEELVKSPGLEINDVAFLGKTDYAQTIANLKYQQTEPRGIFRNYVLLIGGQQSYNYDGDRTEAQRQAYFRGTLRSYWTIEAFAIVNPPALTESRLRGGPMVVSAGHTDYFLEIASDSRKPLSAGVSVEWNTGRGGLNSGMTVLPSLSIKPASNVAINFTPTYYAGHSDQQYVTQVRDPTATLFSGTRYVVSRLDRTDLSLDTRLNITFTPSLTLELFAQPFMSSGKYVNFGEFIRPRARQRTIYGITNGTITPRRDAAGATTSYMIDPDGEAPANAFVLPNPNFNVRSLRGNAVLRWEFRPGSIMYLVWQQTRNGDAPIGTSGDFDFAREQRALFRTIPTNIVQLKMTYWFGH